MNICSLCQSKELDLHYTHLVSSCDHYICSRCLYREVAHNHEQIINTCDQNEQIKLNCIICEKGNFSLSNFELHEKLNENIDINYINKSKVYKCEGGCQDENNKNVVIVFCKNCQIFLCVICLMTHSQDHTFSNKLDQNPNNYCSDHKEESLKFECITCKLAICFLCRDQNHFGHLTNNIKNSHNRKIGKIKSNSLLQNYENFCKLLDHEKNLTLDKLKIETDNRIDIFNKIIYKIKDTISLYENNLNKISENLEISVKNMKFSFKNFISDLETIKSDDYFNAYLVGKLSEKKIELNFRDHILDFFNNSCYNIYSDFNKFENEILNATNLKNLSSYQQDDIVRGLLELKDGRIACWTKEKIKIFKINNENKLELIQNLNFKTYGTNITVNPIEHYENIIFTDKDNQVRIWDKYFRLSQVFQEYSTILSLCEISSTQIAIGLDRRIKIYNRNVIKQSYYKSKEYTDFSSSVNNLVYLSKFDLLISSSSEDKVINMLSFREGKSIKILTDHTNSITSLIYKNDNTFVTASLDGHIKFWHVEKDNIIECIKTIKAYENNNIISLYLLGNKNLISKIIHSSEFKIWDFETLKCTNTCREDSKIMEMIITQNNFIISGLKDKNLNIWKIIE